MGGKYLFQGIGVGGNTVPGTSFFAGNVAVWESVEYLEHAGGNAVEVQLIPHGTGASAFAQIIDSDNSVVGYTATSDSAGQIGTSGAPLTAVKKQQVSSVQRFVKVQIRVTAGTWDVIVADIGATGNTAGSGGVVSGSGTAGAPASGTLTVQGIAGGTPLPIGPTPGTLTDRSGTIATGGTSQQLMAANSTRKYMFIQNNSTGDEWINFTTAAATSQPSIKLTAGQSYENPSDFCSTEAVNIIGATTGQSFSAKEA